MFSKQITNGRLLPQKIWHLPSLSDELYFSKNKRSLIMETSKHSENPKHGELSRIRCSIFDKYNDEPVAEGFYITNMNNKKHIVITEWFISTNAEYVIEDIKDLYSKDSEKAKREFLHLVEKWNIQDGNFEKDIVVSINKEKEMIKNILKDFENHIIPLFFISISFNDETKYESYILEKLAKLGYEYHQLDGFENPIFNTVWKEYGLDKDNKIIQTTEWDKTFSGIFLNLKQEIQHKRIKERPAGGVSELHMTKWGPMSESEDDYED